MLKSGLQSATGNIKRGIPRPVNYKRGHSVSPVSGRLPSPIPIIKVSSSRRCKSLSPSSASQLPLKKSFEGTAAQETASAPEPRIVQSRIHSNQHDQGIEQTTRTVIEGNRHNILASEKDIVLPQCIVTKVMRTLATKKREFVKMRKTLIVQQNSLLENYAAIKELETRAGVSISNSVDPVGEVRVLSVTSWPPYDLLLLIRDDLEIPNSEINGIFGPQVLQQIHAHLNPIPEEMLSMGAELMARRIEILNILRGKHRADRSTYLTNMEWKVKNTEFDHETERLHRMVAGVAENLKAKINHSLELAKAPWLDRDAMVRKIERLQKENLILQNKLEELMKKGTEDNKEPHTKQYDAPRYTALCEELVKERADRDALKDVVSTAESMLRVARARIATLERQLKETRAELDTARRKHKDLEQLYRQRETSYDSRSKKLLEVSKTGEMTIDALSRQRDALESRVKELHEEAEAAERTAVLRESEQRSRADSLQAKVAEQENRRTTAELHIVELEGRVKELEEQLHAMRERSVRLVDMERRRCLECVPSKETEPSDKETEIWKELQVTRVALSRAEEELRRSRADKDSFLNSLSRIAQGDGADSLEDKMATELLDREQKIVKLQHIIEQLRENEKLMEQSMTQYENQLAALRLEVKRLRNYDCFAKDIPYQDLQAELLELHLQVESLSRERSSLLTAAASRALMLERHERAAELFARITRARRELAALLDGRSEPPSIDDRARAEISRSLSSVCASGADTWSALRGERARVLRLESAVVTQSLQLEREGRVRTQLERRRAMLEREMLRAQHSASQSESVVQNPHLIQEYFWSK